MRTPFQLAGVLKIRVVDVEINLDRLGARAVFPKKNSGVSDPAKPHRKKGRNLNLVCNP